MLIKRKLKEIVQQMDKANYIFMLVEAIIFFIPVGTLIWRMAKLSAKVERHDKEIGELRTSLADKVEALTTSVNNLTIQFVELKTEIRVQKEK